MLVMSKGALSAAQAETYYEEKYSQDDYYSEQHRVVGQWFGRGAEELGLSGEIASEDFRAVLRGIHPGSGNVLVQKANGYDDRRAGWDATFNAPKAVSIHALGGGEGQALGYRIRAAGGDGRWELEGYTREHVMAFSRRRQDIEQALSKEGLAGAAAAQNIAHRTRLTKDHRDEQSLRAEWRSRAREFGIQVDQFLSQSRLRGPVQRASSAEIQEALRYSIDENSEREAVIDRRALEAKALQHAMGKTDLDAIQSEARRVERQLRLIPLDGSVISPPAAYTTPQVNAIESEDSEITPAGQ